MSLILTALFITKLQAQLVNSGDIYVKNGAVVWTGFTFENRPGAQLVNDGTVIFKSDIINNGVIRHTTTDESGLVRIEGISTQGISGNGDTRFWDLRLSNDAGFNLSSDLSVFGTADFNSGIVQTNNSNSVFGFSLGGESINSSDESFVDGIVGAETDSELLFPTGDSQFRRILLAAPTTATNEISLQGQYFFEDPGLLYPRDQTSPNLTLIDDAEFWELENSSAVDSPLLLTLSWRDVTTPAFILGDPTKIAIAKWDNTQNLWISEGGVSDLTNQLISSEVSLSGTTVYTLGVLTAFTNLGLTKTSFGESIWEGDQFDYELTLQNNSEEVATDVVLVDNLPSGLEFVSVEGESIFGLLDFEVEILGQTVTIRIPEFIGGDEATFTLKVRAVDPGRILNIAEVSSFQPDEDPDDNIDTDENEVKAFFIPNVITPNSDGDNDQFEVKGLNKFSSNKITIFNRYGDIILETDNYQNDWDAKGLVAGTYFYVLEVVELDGRPQSFKGWIQVILNE